MTDDGEIFYNIVGKKVGKDQKKIVEQVFKKTLKDPNFKSELKEQAKSHIDGGQLKGTDREKKLQKIVDKL